MRIVTGLAAALFAATAVTHAGATSFDPCAFPDTPEPQPVNIDGNSNVNVNITSCIEEVERITEVSVDGAAPLAIEPVHGSDAAAVAAALEAAADLLGLPVARLDVLSLALESEEDVLVELIASAGSGVPAQLGVDYLGDPDDYSTWIAAGQTDVQVNVALSIFQVDNLRLEATLVSPLSTVPLPAGLPLMLAGLGTLAFAARRV